MRLGQTHKEQLRSREERKERLLKWRTSFAFWPVEITYGTDSGKHVWLELYEWRWQTELCRYKYVRVMK